MANADIQPGGKRGNLGDKMKTTYDYRVAANQRAKLEWQVLVDSKVKSVVGGAALRCWCCKELIFGRADFAVVFVINVYARMPQEAPKAWKRFPGAFSSRSSDEAPSGAYLPVDHEALYKHR